MMRDIPGFPGYMAGCDGHIYSFVVRGRVDKSRIPKKLKASIQSNGRYFFVVLRKSGVSYQQRVHRLVCSTFHGECPKGFVASHTNGNWSDNKPSNLTWESQQDNLVRRFGHGRGDRGVDNTRALFNLKQIRRIRTLLSRGLTAREIAKRMECNERDIGKIKQGERYAGQR